MLLPCCCHAAALQSISTVKQADSMLKQQWIMDHLTAGSQPADLKQNPQYQAALQMAKEAALPDKGERPDRDPQVSLWHW
jgi:hypothetical protein